MKVSFIGLGVMGYPIAGHISQAGHDVCVYNRSPDKAQRWLDTFAGTHAQSPAQAADGADLVAVCVGNDDDVRAVLYGEGGALSGMRSGTILVDHTTASAELAREIHSRCSEQEIGFLDAPVSGGQAGAEKGALTVMVGGQPVDFERALPVMEVYARCVKLLGPSGSGQLAKMVNQLCIAGIVQGLSEAMLFSQQAGLDTAAVIDVISQGAAQSWQMENRYRSMLDGHYEHGFAVDWMRKDLSIVFAEAERLQLDLPLARMVDGFYAQIQAMGGSRWDTSSLFARMQADQCGNKGKATE